MNGIVEYGNIVTDESGVLTDLPLLADAQGVAKRLSVINQKVYKVYTLGTLSARNATGWTLESTWLSGRQFYKAKVVRA